MTAIVRRRKATVIFSQWSAYVKIGVAVGVRPGLWLISLRQMRTFAPDGWWRRWPFLPVPRSDMIRFRMVTMYGNPDAVPTTADFVGWLEWCKLN